MSSGVISYSPDKKDPFPSLLPFKRFAWQRPGWRKCRFQDRYNSRDVILLGRRMFCGEQHLQKYRVERTEQRQNAYDLSFCQKRKLHRKYAKMQMSRLLLTCLIGLQSTTCSKQ